jgi:hypothetical protein
VPIVLPGGLPPGSGHLWEAEVVDPSRNTTSVAGKFYAPNERPASLRLNEVRIAGSGNRSDFVELRVEADGNLGGWTLEAWTTPQARQRLVLPDAPANKGDLVVVRFRTPEEPTDTAPTAREYWPSEAKGLSPTKGVIVLRPAPQGEPLEALVYSKKPGDAVVLAEAAGWTGAGELDPTGCTPTRTWSRLEDGGWIVTATGGSTPGEPNSSTPWEGLISSRAGSTTTKERTKPPRRAVPKRGRRSRRDSRPNPETEVASRDQREPNHEPQRGRTEKRPPGPESRAPRGRVRLRQGTRLHK